MADLSFFPGGKDNSGGGGSGGTTDYNELRNRPVTNINGNGSSCDNVLGRLSSLRRDMETGGKIIG